MIAGKVWGTTELVERNGVLEFHRIETKELRHVHVNDPNGRGPGFGNLQFAPLLKILHETDYPGYISVEVFDFAPDPQTIAGRSLGYLHGILESLGAKAKPAKLSISS